MANTNTEFAGLAARLVAAQDRFIEFAMTTAGLTRDEAIAAYAYMRRGGKRAPLTVDAATGQFTFSHGAFAEADVLRRAAVLEAERLAAA